MSKSQLFKDFVNERLAVAALDIFEQFDKALAECQEEVFRSKEQNKKQQIMLDIFMNQPRIKLHRTVVHQPSLPGPPEIKPHPPVVQPPSLPGPPEIKPQIEPHPPVVQPPSLPGPPDFKPHPPVVQPPSLPGPPEIKPQIKQEPALWTIQEGEQLQQLQPTQTKATEEPIKAESAIVDYGAPEPASHSQPLTPDSRTGPFKWTIQEGKQLQKRQPTQTKATEEPIKAESAIVDYGAPEPASHSQPLAPDSRTGPVICSISGSDSEDVSSWEPESKRRRRDTRDTAEKPYQSEEHDEAVSRPDIALSALQNINEDDSEGGESAELDVGDEMEAERNRSLESDSDSESSEDETEAASQQSGKDGTLWSEIPTANSWGRAQGPNTMHETPGPTRYAKDNITSALSSLLCLIDREMLDNIFKYTKAEAGRSNSPFHLTMDELIGFFGLIYLRGATGNKSMSLEDYWSTEWGNPYFKETLSRQKFRDIMRCLRFDDRTTRSARLVDDKFAMISELFDQFVKNSIASYTPGENITVDEQLFPTQAQCRFAQFMANKPDKFGIKFWVAADTATNYVVNMYPYLGEEGNRPACQKLSDIVIMNLMEPFLEKGRNVTTKNFFTSLPLAKNLLGHKTTIIGKIRRELPPCAKAQSERFSTKVMSAGDATLTIYQAKPKKNLCLLSTMHQAVSIDEGTKKLPNTVAHYNATKYGVDIMDQMAQLYSVKGGTRRWPVAVFYNMLDLAAINAYILYKECMGVDMSRKEFILQLAKEMCAPQRMAMVARNPYAKRKRCQIRHCSGNKTCDVCCSCKRLVCGTCCKHPPPMCMDC